MLEKKSSRSISERKAVINLADFKPSTIHPKDDAFHGSNNFLDIEWWYFEAIFNNGYSTHVGVRTFHIGRFGIVTLSLEFYHKGKSEREQRKIYLHHDCLFSQEKPYININDDCVIRFDTKQYAESNKWVYQVHVQLGDQEVDLTFTGTTQGWKYEPPTKNCWAVPLPKANVEGTITVDGKQHAVKGKGYHDHNWDYTIITALNNRGWYWGKIAGEHNTVTWAKTFRSWDKGEHLAVLNMDDDGFVMIEPDHISFVPKNLVKDHGRLVPTRFDFQGTATTSDGKPVSIDVEMKAVKTDFEKLFTISYWRYHVVASGHITVGQKQEKLDDRLQIMEFLLFR